MARSDRLARALRLIVITDEELAAARGGVHVVVQRALAAGARAIQLRMKGRSAHAMLEAAHFLRRVTLDAGALLFVNDRVDVAMAAAADGVHLGPEDVPVAAIRRMSGPDLVIGYSADDPGAAVQAVADGADYIGCGTVFPTASKEDAGEEIGLSRLDEVAAAVDVPVVGVGGITTVERASEVGRTRATGIAVLSAVMSAEDPGRAVELLFAAMQDGGR